MIFEFAQKSFPTRYLLPLYRFERIEGPANLGFSQETVAQLFTQDFAGRVGFRITPSPIIRPTSADLKSAWPQSRTRSTTQLRLRRKK
jgi:hypothetical protein